MIDVDEPDEDANDTDDLGEEISKLVELFLQRGLFALLLRNVDRNLERCFLFVLFWFGSSISRKSKAHLSNLGLRTSVDNDGTSLTHGDGGARKHKVNLVLDGRLLADRLDLLHLADALACFLIIATSLRTSQPSLHEIPVKMDSSTRIVVE